MKFSRRKALSIFATALVATSPAFGGGTYSVTIPMWDVGTAVVGGEATYSDGYYIGGGYIDEPPIELGQDVSNSGILSIDIEATTSDWINIVTGPVLDGYGGIEAEAGTETPNGGQTDGGGGYIEWYPGADGGIAPVLEL